MRTLLASCQRTSESYRLMKSMYSALQTSPGTHYQLHNEIITPLLLSKLLTFRDNTYTFCHYHTGMGHYDPLLKLSMVLKTPVRQGNEGSFYLTTTVLILFRFTVSSISQCGITCSKVLLSGRLPQNTHTFSILLSIYYNLYIQYRFMMIVEIMIGFSDVLLVWKGKGA